MLESKLSSFSLFFFLSLIICWPKAVKNMVGMVSTTLSSNCRQVSPSPHPPQAPLGTQLGQHVLCCLGATRTHANTRSGWGDQCHWLRPSAPLLCSGSPFPAPTFLCSRFDLSSSIRTAGAEAILCEPTRPLRGVRRRRSSETPQALVWVLAALRF